MGKLVVIDETPEFVVVNKPAGVAMQSDTKHLESDIGLVIQVKEQLGDRDLRPCHRLDRGTSGLVLFAKSAEVAARVSELFQQGEVAKYYWGVTDKKGKKKQGTVSGGMARSRDGLWKLTDAKENMAVTQFFSYGLGEGLRALLLKPITGKTHQLRVAMKALSMPLLGDVDYGGKGADRMYLHAFHLSFPFDNRSYVFSAPPDKGEVFSSEAFTKLAQQHTSPGSLSWPKRPTAKRAAR